MAMPESKSDESVSAPKKETPKKSNPSKPITKSEIKQGECKILESKYDSHRTCSYSQCPITEKHILFGMHCVTYQEKNYHASCAKQVGIEFKIQKPARRPPEASK